MPSHHPDRPGRGLYAPYPMRKYLPHTLYGQMVLVQLLLFGLAAILFPAVLLASLHKTADEFVAKRLHADASRIEALLWRPGQISTQEVQRDLGPLFRNRSASRAFLVIDAAGRALLTGGIVNDLRALPALAVGATEFTHVGKMDVFAEKVRINGRVYSIGIAQDRTRPEVIVDDVVASFLRQTLWIVPLIFLVSTLLSTLVIRRMTIGIRRVADEAERINPSTLDLRLQAGHLPREARSLALATNRALDRVEEGYRRQANFVSSVAHELRTPLALVALRCEALPPVEEKAALRRAVDQATHVVAQLMELATIENGHPKIEEVDLGRVACDAVEASAPLVYRSGRTIEVVKSSGPVEPVTGNEGLLRIALANLIDNAVRHTPSATHIVVAPIAGAIFVSDNGPGITVEEVGPTVRYRSASRQRSDSSGLGMSIVQRIMIAMGGTMNVVPDTPGTCIRLQLNATV